ncbi:hypothetical protein B0T10DRAFT_572404, partial [Thelonectria olida]
MAPQPKNRVKSRSGCVRCKQKHVKCDEAVPSCLTCVRGGLACPGYRKPVKWSDKHEKLKVGPPRLATGFGGGLENFWATFTEEAAKLHAAIASDAQSSPPITTQPATSSDSWGVATDSHLLPENNNPTYREENGRFSAASSMLWSDHNIDPPNSYSRDKVEEAVQNDDLDEPECSDQVFNRFVLLKTQSDTLSSYYFSWVCGINSGFDSPSNPLRALVANFMPTHPLISHCMLSMSAAHLYQHEGDVASVALEHRTEAISCLASDIQ